MIIDQLRRLGHKNLAHRNEPLSLCSGFLAVGLCFISAVLLSSMPVHGQEIGRKFGGFSHSSNAPINIEADQLVVNDLKKSAVFSGDVKAVQEGFVLRSRVLEVYYSGSPQAGGGGASGKVRRLIAKGKVFINTKDKQSATSEWANFDVLKQIITLGDTVVLTQGENIIRGGQLRIDLKTRQSRFVNKPKKGRQKGRVQMKVDVKSNKVPKPAP